MTARYRCAAASLAVGEPRYATASTVRRWLLVEQPGPWGVDAVVESRMPPPTAAALAALGRQLRARVLLIRRPGGAHAASTRVVVAFTGVRRRWVETFDVTGPADVLDLDLAPLRAGEPVGGRRSAAPMLLVCTNGRHDPCCAEFGRPVADVLHREIGDVVWEVSHIGGDRFAGNLVTLPHGIYYGGLDTDNAVDVARAHLDGLIALAAYRGRSAHPFVVQAAEYFLRRDRGITAIDDARWTDRTRLDDARWTVAFATADGPVTVEVTVDRAEEARQLTCRSDALARAPRYTLVAISAGG